VFPLGIPLIAGPAAITTTILVASRYSQELALELAAFAALLLVLGVTWLAFRLADLLQRRLGPTVINVLSRLLGLLLGALAVQYVLDGIADALAR
jgi:multiple antibiotic resistance protein